MTTSKVTAAHGLTKQNTLYREEFHFNPLKHLGHFTILKKSFKFYVNSIAYTQCVMRFHDYEWLIWTDGKKRSCLKALLLHLPNMTEENRSQLPSKD
jgi:hypothetical protein